MICPNAQTFEGMVCIDTGRIGLTAELRHLPNPLNVIHRRL